MVRGVNVNKLYPLTKLVCVARIWCCYVLNSISVCVSSLKSSQIQDRACGRRNIDSVTYNIKCKGFHRFTFLLWHSWELRSTTGIEANTAPNTGSNKQKGYHQCSSPHIFQRYMLNKKYWYSLSTN